MLTPEQKREILRFVIDSKPDEEYLPGIKNDHGSLLYFQKEPGFRAVCSRGGFICYRDNNVEIKLPEPYHSDKDLHQDKMDVYEYIKKLFKKLNIPYVGKQ